MSDDWEADVPLARGMIDVDCDCTREQSSAVPFGLLRYAREGWACCRCGKIRHRYVEAPRGA